MPSILAHGRKEQGGLYEFGASLVYIGDSKIVRTSQRNPALNNNEHIHSVLVWVSLL